MSEWDDVVDRHARLVYGVAYRIVGRIQDAEDVAQETFREAFDLSRQGKVTDWRGCLCRIATFRAIDVVRKIGRQGALDLDRAAPEFGPQAEAEARELAERLQASLPELPRRAAAVFSLTFFEHLSRDEVAGTLGMTPQAVSVALFKARKQLQQLLLIDDGPAKHDSVEPGGNDPEQKPNEVCHETRT
jgi:RNA polymerase sigma-70 factor (ECF subfamily)